VVQTCSTTDLIPLIKGATVTLRESKVTVNVTFILPLAPPLPVTHWCYVISPG
jgi:hypothetical protein